MQDKTLYLHAGGLKTGTSAIQNFLGRNKKQLTSSGISYLGNTKIAHNREVTSGNGVPLYFELITNNPDSHLDNLLQGYLGVNAKGICSYEGFSLLSEVHWIKLINSAKRLDIRLEVIFYVRNVIPFFISVYDQTIKRHGESRTIEEWIFLPDNKWQHLETLKILYALKEDVIFHVLSYDQHARSLLKSFLCIIKMDRTINITKEDDNRVVNRSLTNSERIVLQTINKSFTQKSEELSDMFLYSRPDAKTSFTYPKLVVKVLSKRFSQDVVWVNNSFFHGKKIVGLHLSKDQNDKNTASVGLSTFFNIFFKKYFHSGYLANLSVLIKKFFCLKREFFRKKSCVDTQDQADALTTLLEWTIKILEDDQTSSIKFIVSKLNQIDWNNASHDDIPDNFNPVAYLLINVDVLLSEIKPHEHYISYGQYESREWSWPISVFTRHQNA